MTSREALNTICLECQRDKGKIQVACPFRSISNDYCDEYEQIKKDLEVLEILKKHLYNDGWSNGYVIMFWNMNEKELTKIKEWLENL